MLWTLGLGLLALGNTKLGQALNLGIVSGSTIKNLENYRLFVLSQNPTQNSFGPDPYHVSALLFLYE